MFLKATSTALIKWFGHSTAAWQTCVRTDIFLSIHVHCVQKNTHSHFLPYLHEWCV